MYQQLSEKHRPQLEAIRQSIARKLWVAGLLCVAAAILILWFFPFGSARAMTPVNAMGSLGLSNFITGEIEGRPFQLCCMSLQGTGDDKTKFKGLI